ncbi:glycosyltransferase [Belliella aquatica]|nr:glycosyltransferase [Belliella aquatica]MCH7404604.1 glycosyltransferase [Belliella aquatica]
MIAQPRKTMDRLFFYPKVDFTQVESPNPYIVNMEGALSAHFKIVNKKENRGGVLEFFENLFRTDIYFFNWVENLPIYRFGKLQVMFFILFTWLAKLMNKKMIWVLHNKYSHSTDKNFWTDWMYKVLIKSSDLIITHSSEGIDFVANVSKGMEGKVHYLPHPARPRIASVKSSIKEYDLLIWGALHPYKGVADFLEFINKNLVQEDKITVLIIGKCFDQDYLIRLNKSLNEKITHINEFRTLEEISSFAQKSKYVFFPYNSPSLLSSGTLMDSMRMDARILGPNIGSFKDLSYMGVIENYSEFEDIQQIITAYQDLRKSEIAQLRVFFRENSWKNFATNLNVIYRGLRNN